jgi:hypothetical protein
VELEESWNWRLLICGHGAEEAVPPLDSGTCDLGSLGHWEDTGLFLTWFHFSAVCIREALLHPGLHCYFPSFFACWRLAQLCIYVFVAWLEVHLHKQAFRLLHGFIRKS